MQAFIFGFTDQHNLIRFHLITHKKRESDYLFQKSRFVYAETNLLPLLQTKELENTQGKQPSLKEICFSILIEYVTVN